MNPELLELISTMRFHLLGVVVIALLKTEMINVFKGIQFRFDRDFNEGDPVYLDCEKGRLVKIGLFQSKMYMYHADGTITMRKFNNFDMNRLKMEKILRKHGE